MTTDPSTPPTLAELEERVRNGDTTITAADLAQAREAENLASLHQEAARRAQEATDAREYEAAVEQVTADYEKLRGDGSSKVRTAYAKAVTAIANLTDALNEITDKRDALRDRANILGVLGGQFQDLFRVPALPTDTYLQVAIREARGEYLGGHGNAHALHSDKQVAEHEERQRKLLEAEAEREAKFLENAEVVQDLGWGNYRRIEV